MCMCVYTYIYIYLERECVCVCDNAAHAVFRAMNSACPQALQCVSDSARMHALTSSPSLRRSNGALMHRVCVCVPVRELRAGLSTSGFERWVVPESQGLGLNRP